MTSWLACALRIYTPIGYRNARWAFTMDEQTHLHHSHSHDSHVKAESVIDPVCGMSVDPHTAPHRHAYQGRPYYFCSNGCRTKFAADPARYVSPGATATPAVSAGTIYTCPMHPQIRQIGPGS